jgi:hypothetical protein
MARILVTGSSFSSAVSRNGKHLHAVRFMLHYGSRSICTSGDPEVHSQLEVSDIHAFGFTSCLTAGTHLTSGMFNRIRTQCNKPRVGRRELPCEQDVEHDSGGPDV